MNDTEQSMFPIDHVAIIRRCYREKQAGEWDLYDACAEANSAWSETAKRAKLKQLKELFPPSKFSMYVQIGADERLKDPLLRGLLPPGYSIHHHVHMLKDDELESFRRDREAKKGQRLRRADVARFRKSSTEKAQRREVKLPDVFYAAVKPTRQWTNTERDNLDGELSELASKYGLQVIQTVEQQLPGEDERRSRFMRSETRKFVRNEIKMRKAPGKYKGKPHLRKYAGFLPEEVEIKPDADEDRLREVLETLGSEDQFGIICKTAYDRFPCEQKFTTPRWLEAVADKRPTFAALAAEVAEIRAPPISSYGINEDMKKAFEGFK